MRNGNTDPKILALAPVFQFLPYLWGMETLFRYFFLHTLTCSYRTYEEWKHGKKFRALTVKYSSYRTYEEWKLLLPRVLSCTIYTVLTVPMRNGNDAPHDAEATYSVSSYRTYEEWKHGTNKWNYDWEWVLTVPMRNGNLQILWHVWNCDGVLTVPMRNGNLAQNGEQT